MRLPERQFGVSDEGICQFRHRGEASSGAIAQVVGVDVQRLHDGGVQVVTGKSVGRVSVMTLRNNRDELGHKVMTQAKAALAARSERDTGIHRRLGDVALCR